MKLTPLAGHSQVAALAKVLPGPAAASNGASMDTDDVEDVSLRAIDDMGAENQRRCEF